MKIYNYLCEDFGKTNTILIFSCSILSILLILVGYFSHLFFICIAPLPLLIPLIVMAKIILKDEPEEITHKTKKEKLR